MSDYGLEPLAGLYRVARVKFSEDGLEPPCGPCTRACCACHCAV